MKIKYEIVIGTGFDKTGAKIEGYDIDTILKDIASHFGGYSLNFISGGYIMQSDGSFVKESSINISILAKTPHDIRIRGLANELKRILNQESVLVVKSKVSAKFV